MVDYGDKSSSAAVQVFFLLMAYVVKVLFDVQEVDYVTMVGDVYQSILKNGLLLLLVSLNGECLQDYISFS